MGDLTPFLVGRCGVWREFLERLDQAARSDAAVLLVGESGSGKSVAARELHRRSARADAPLVEVSLPALSPSLIEAELFGHAEGAFTGAGEARLGRMRQAQGGTLVLDDLQSLPLTQQVKLLRVLQEKQVEPVGAEGSIAIDVRVVATVQGDLEREVREGRFRSDLYWRLNVVQLTLPPLRARIEDLEHLVPVLSELIARRHGRPARPFAPRAWQRLMSHRWPGNLRELENALERWLVLAPAGAPAPIEEHELEFLFEAREGSEVEVAQRALALGLTLPQLEHALIRQALKESRGNLSAAARLIGVTRRALEYRLGRAEDEAAGDQA